MYVYIYIYLCLCSKNGNSIYIYMCVFTLIHVPRKPKYHDLDLQKNLWKGTEWNRDVQSARSIWRYFIQKAFALDSNPYPSWKLPHISDPPEKENHLPKIPWGDKLVVSSQEGHQSGGVKRFEIIPNDSRNKPWEVGHEKDSNFCSSFDRSQFASRVSISLQKVVETYCWKKKPERTIQDGPKNPIISSVK